MPLARVGEIELSYDGERADGIGHLFFWEQPARSAELVRAHTAVHA